MIAPAPLPSAPLAEPSSWDAARAGFVVGASRLVHRSTALAAILAASLGLAGGLVERRVTSAHAVDRALSGAFGLVIPLVAVALVGRVTGRARLGDRAFRVARFGLDGRPVALGLVASAAATSAAVAVIGASCALLSARSPGAPPLALDLFATAWIAALTGAAYAAWCAFGATFLRAGRGRFVPLVIDLALGGAGGALGLALPRAHAAILLGAAPAADLPAYACGPALALMTIALAAGAAARSARPGR
jgi:hypothetical protein